MLTVKTSVSLELKFVRNPTPFLVDDIRTTAAKFQSVVQITLNLFLLLCTHLILLYPQNYETN